MKLDIKKLYRSFIIIVLVLFTAYMFLLYYSPSASTALNDPSSTGSSTNGYRPLLHKKNDQKTGVIKNLGNEEGNEEDSDNEKNESKEGGKEESKNDVNYDADKLPKYTANFTASFEDYIKIIKALNSVTSDLYQDNDFGNSLTLLKNRDVLKDFQKDFEYLDYYRNKFLLTDKKNELIFPNGNLSFLSKLVKLEKMDPLKTLRDEHRKNAILALKGIEDFILSKDFAKKIFDM